MDWFGLRQAAANKCVFCNDRNVDPFDGLGLNVNRYKTTSCRHRVCGKCESNIVGGRPLCPLCQSVIGTLTDKDPQFLALKSLNDIREQVCEVYSLDLERDFAGNMREYNDFIERREDIICAQQRADLESKTPEERRQASLRLKAEREEFAKLYKEQIERNLREIASRRARMQNEIREEREEMRLNKERMREEKAEEERERQLQRENNRRKRLGIREGGGGGLSAVPGKPRENVAENHQRAPVANVDILSVIPRALPTLLVTSNGSGQELDPASRLNQLLAGGWREADETARTLQEMRAGWSALLPPTQAAANKS